VIESTSEPLRCPTMKGSRLTSHRRRRSELAALEVQLRWLFRYIASIIIGTPASPGETPVNTGSGIIVRTPDDLFLVTAGHVLAGFEGRLTQPGLSFQIGKLNLQVTDERRIWKNRDDDVAAIAVTEHEGSRIGTLIHQPTEWPPVIPQHNDYVTVTGLPAMRRTRPDSGTILFGPLLAHLPVLGSFLNHFTCRIDRQYIQSLAPSGLPVTGIDYGGMSGGPVFLDSSLHYPLVGIVKEVKEDLEYFVIQGLRNVPSRIPPV
jgi:hypothetical protein